MARGSVSRNDVVVRREAALAAGYESDEQIVGDNAETAKGHFYFCGEAEDAVLSRCRRQITVLYSIWVRI